MRHDDTHDSSAYLGKHRHTRVRVRTYPCIHIHAHVYICCFTLVGPVCADSLQVWVDFSVELDMCEPFWIR